MFKFQYILSHSKDYLSTHFPYAKIDDMFEAERDETGVPLFRVDRSKRKESEKTEAPIHSQESFDPLAKNTKRNQIEIIAARLSKTRFQTHINNSTLYENRPTQLFKDTETRAFNADHLVLRLNFSDDIKRWMAWLIAKRDHPYLD